MIYRIVRLVKSCVESGMGISGTLTTVPVEAGCEIHQVRVCTRGLTFVRIGDREVEVELATSRLLLASFSPDTVACDLKDTELSCYTAVPSLKARGAEQLLFAPSDPSPRLVVPLTWLA